MVANMRVLIADSFQTIRGRIVKMLSYLDGVRMILQARSVEEARQICRRHRPQVLILAYELPFQGALPLVRELTTLTPKPYILIYGDSSYPEVEAQCIEAGADCFLHKTTRLDEIPRVVQKLLDAQQSHDPPEDHSGKSTGANQDDAGG